MSGVRSSGRRAFLPLRDNPSGGVQGFIGEVEDAPLLGDEIISPKLQKDFTASRIHVVTGHKPSGSYAAMEEGLRRWGRIFPYSANP